MTTKTKSSNIAPDPLEGIVGASGDAMKQGFEKVAKSFDSAAVFSKATVDALLESANVRSKGFEALSAETIAFSKKGLEDAVAVTKAAQASRSVQEVAELSSAFTKSVFEAYVAHIKTVGGILVAMTKEAAEPLNGRTAALMKALHAGPGL